jgi:mono/diheme cytochrome c family protein
VRHLEEALAEGIVTAHPDMPEFVFSAEEASDIVAYLESLPAGKMRHQR